MSTAQHRRTEPVSSARHILCSSQPCSQLRWPPASTTMMLLPMPVPSLVHLHDYVLAFCAGKGQPCAADV